MAHQQTSQDDFSAELIQLAVRARHLKAKAPAGMEQARADAILRLAVLELQEVGLPARVHHAEALSKSILDIADAVDPLILAIGEEARDHWSDLDMRCFDRPVFGALEGDAAFTITDAAEAEEQDRYDYRRDYAAELSRAARSEWSA